MPDTLATARQVLTLARDCAASCYTHTPPAAHYADRVARLVFMTIAHESDGFRARRQYGFAADSTAGAFGIAQVEWATAAWLLTWLHHHNRRPMVARARCYLMRHGLNDIDLLNVNRDRMLRLLQTPEGDPLAVLLCRVRYLVVPSPVPAHPTDMASYAKRHYNTHAGKATWKNYLDAYTEWWPRVTAP